MEIDDLALCADVARLRTRYADAAAAALAEIRLTKFQPACLFCGESLEVVDFRGKRVCRGCIRKLQKSLKVNKRRPVRGRR